jgi:uncharacterized protein YwqG
MTGDFDLESPIGVFIALTKEMAATRHTGRYTRLFYRRRRLFEDIKATSDGPAALQALMDHPDPKVQLDAARICKPDEMIGDVAFATLRRLAQRSDDIGHDARSSLETVSRNDTRPPASARDIAFLPLPGRCSQSVAAQIIRKSPLRHRADELVALLRPCIGLWPIADPKRLASSRFGGMPAVPANFVWPFDQQEPFWFLAQINCSELGPLAKAFGLPQEGMLSFFGDHDDVNGCDSCGRGAVYYFADIESLKEAALPLDDFVPSIACGIGFYENCELPHPASETIVPLNFTEEEHDDFYDLAATISGLVFQDLPRDGGAFDRLASADERSKLFGWPHLIQGALATDFHRGEGQRLLLQLGDYHNGCEWHSWGPGGLVYFTIDEDDFLAQRFDRAALDMQCT